MTTMYYDKDADLRLLAGKTIAILGYGSQGHAQAQNLRDSGVKVIVSELEGTPNYVQAVKDGFKPVSAAEAAKKADIVHFLLPDEVQAKVYHEDVRPSLKKGMALAFSHGFNIHYGRIVPPGNVDVYMVAPKGPGHLVRRVFTEGKGVPCLIAVHQDATKKAKKLALAHARGVGGTRAGVIETTFAEETETDLFGEQCVLCGGLTELVRAGFECLHEMKLIVDLMHENGIQNMRYSISDTAEYGDVTRGPRIITAETRLEMKRILKEIQSGEFAREWILENMAGRPVYKALVRQGKAHLIEKVGAKLRGMMSWIGKK